MTYSDIIGIMFSEHNIVMTPIWRRDYSDEDFVCVNNLDFRVF